MSAHEIDVFVGGRIKQGRWKFGFTQEQLAKACGIKFQQVQKYESGRNRVSCSRLWQVAEAFGVPVSWFFPDGEEHPHTEHFSKEDYALMRTIQKLSGRDRAAVETMVKSLGTKETND